MLALPFFREERDDFLTAVDEVGAVAPFGVRRVGERNAFGIAAVPAIVSQEGLRLRIDEVPVR